MMSVERKLIVVTGFGPFLGHEEVNASWEAVKILPDEIIDQETKTIFKIQKQMVAVEYAAVDETLVVHVGVSGIAKCVYVEKLAYNHQFRRPDNTGQYLSGSTCCLAVNAKANVLRCGLNVDKIVEAVNATCDECVAPSRDNNDKALTATKASKNVGGFLCGYIYLKSLDMDKKRSLFVHVPPIDKPFNTAQTSSIVYNIIAECMRQLNCDCEKD
ncbi:CG32147 [Drosophila busckii]|uniref:CG32147 n=1 Tax=Drosophila busckii TaxID=30019 RepID=A0A0M3QWT5_DROBS|nr:CG32147 [Drosophila busckii]